MTDKPMTQYIEHKYPESAGSAPQLQEVLTQVNDILSRVSSVEKDMKKLRVSVNHIGECCLRQGNFFESSAPRGRWYDD